MLTIFSEYLTVATRLDKPRMRDLPRNRPGDKGRWRAAPNWRDLPEEF